jgi:hypothetical protein
MDPVSIPGLLSSVPAASKSNQIKGPQKDGFPKDLKELANTPFSYGTLTQTDDPVERVTMTPDPIDWKSTSHQVPLLSPQMTKGANSQTVADMRAVSQLGI